MNFDNYDYEIIQKHRIAVAIAVLKTKPNEKTLEQHIEELKNKLDDNKMDDIDITICSDDFDIDDESFDENHKTDDQNHIITENEDIIQNISLDSVNILRNFDEPNKTVNDNIFYNIEAKNLKKSQDNELSEVFEILKEIDHSAKEENYNIATQSTFYEISQPNVVTQTNQSMTDIDRTYCENVEYSRDRNDDKVFENKNSQSKNQNNDFTFDSQATEVYTVHGFTENNTHVSQSQICDLVIPKKFVVGANIPKSNKSNCEAKSGENAIINNNFNNIDNDNSRNDDTENLLPLNDINNDSQNVIELCNLNCVLKENITMQVDHIDYLSKDTENIPPTQRITFDKSIKLPNKQNLQDVNIEPVHKTDFSQDVESDEDIVSQKELVPFKVVEDLNKIRNYLDRRPERRMSNDGSMDSGYRSDSQGKCYRAFQASGNWLNESAYSLYSYITKCPLATGTREITEEIAQVLGELIDKLHEDELYPEFLEELLDYVDVLLQDVFTKDDALLEKDEKIQRIMLLNKSIHIIKYSVEKIICVLKTAHAKLIAEELYEITDIIQVENLSYIFHMLEILIKRYLKCKNVIETTQSSQDSNTFKKSCITNIWRKKWNPNFKESDILDNVVEKKCVFSKCSDILNKIIVDCMGGYSLVAFAALQCFNLLQS